MIKVGVNGACGRMGQRFLDLIPREPDMEIVAALEYEGHPKIGEDAGLLAGRGRLGVPLRSELPKDVDVLIDFSTPASTAARATECAAAGVAMVIGTTGLSEEQMRVVHGAAQRIPIFISPNMSVGVNVVFDIAARIARMLGEEYDVEIVETHHRFKKDAPSGTAIRLAEKIAEALGRDLKSCAIYGREGQVGERPSKQIGLHAVRAGDVVGEHRVIFGTLGEVIELTHRAHTRDTFARGAIRAARFIVGRQPRLYGMEDMLKANR